jgi:hypothetical protein
MGSLSSAAHAQFGVRASIHSTQWQSSGRSGTNSASTRQHLKYQVGFNYQVPLTGHPSLLPEPRGALLGGGTVVRRSEVV